MDNRHILFFRLDVHYFNHHTNGQLRIYGNELLAVVPSDDGGKDVSYEITPKEVIYLSHDDDQCIAEENLYTSDNISKVDIPKCLEQYIASKMDCTLPWLAKNGTHYESLCQHPEEYDTYVHLLYDVVFQFDTVTISSAGNCIPSCTRHEYSVKHMMTYDKTWENSTTVNFYFGKDRFAVKKQYYTYDFQNFLADFGGYLGLLLGYSILGFYDTLIDLVKVAYDKKWAGKCIFCK